MPKPIMSFATLITPSVAVSRGTAERVMAGVAKALEAVAIRATEILEDEAAEAKGDPPEEVIIIITTQPPPGGG